jgi:hypothetical protein
LGTTVPSPLTVSSTLRDWSVTIAASGTRTTSCSGEPGTRMRPNMPGVIRYPGLGVMARPRMVPLVWLTTLLTKFMVPGCSQSVSSTSLTSIGVSRSRVEGSSPAAAARW